MGEDVDMLSPEESKRLVACLTRLRDAMRMQRSIREQYPDGVNNRVTPFYREKLAVLEEELNEEFEAD